MYPAVILFWLSLLQLTTASELETSDFVIVGAGTAGCVMAARLCEALPKAKITLLERASPRNSDAEFIVRSPLQARKALGSLSVSEIFPSAPNPGLNNRSTPVVTGNTLGGSSAINGMQWTVPLAGNIEAWNITNLTTRSAQKYYVRAFNKLGIAIQKAPFKQIYARDYIAAAGAGGIQENANPFDGNVDTSVWENFLAVDPQGRRIDSCTAYIKPVLNGKCRDNLNLVQSATVSKLLLEDGKKKPRVKGVEYVDTSDKKLLNKKVVYAQREVILCAGPYGSPKLLQLSGIGPRDLLEKLGIDVKLDLPVGNQTQARALCTFKSHYKNKPIEPSNNEVLLESSQAHADWDVGRGSVYGTSILAINGRLNRDAYFSMGTTFERGAGMGEPLISSFCLATVESYGHLRIRENNPFAALDVNQNFLGDQADMGRVLSCMQRMARVHDNFPVDFGMQHLTPKVEIDENFIRRTSNSAYHFVGGCPVGSVVSGRLLVKGVRALRVVDASVIKKMPDSSGPISSVYMIAEFISTEIVRKNIRRYCIESCRGTKQFCLGSTRQ